MHALVVDDDRQLRELISEHLEHEGFEVTTARDGQEALRLLHGGAAPDVIVLDDEMPRLKGSDLLARLRAEGHGVAVVLVSGSLALDAQECARLGVGPVVRKPVALQDLLQAVSQAVGSRPSL
ncbi:MAG: response regulator [Vicinamibacteria bacterium]